MAIVMVKSGSIVRKVEIRNKAGIHVRPTGLIVQAARSFPCSVTIRSKGMEADGKDHFGILTLGLMQGDIVEIQLNGEGAEAAAETLAELFAREFDFPR